MLELVTSISDEDLFGDAHDKVVRMHGLIEPIDITTEDDETHFAARVHVQAFEEPPRLLKTYITFEEIRSDGVVVATAIDREFEEHRLDDEGNIVVTRRTETQERELGDDNKLPTIWRGPEQPVELLGKERDLAFNGLVEAIDALS
jgi:hypothetical protein